MMKVENWTLVCLRGLKTKSTFKGFGLQDGDNIFGKASRDCARCVEMAGCRGVFGEWWGGLNQEL